jgi:uncharacterized membrane protein YkoI
MNKTRTAATALAAVLTLGGLTACGSSDQLDGSDRTKAEKAALSETGGGKVTDAEKTDGDDAKDHAYEVQVSLDNGDEVDVDLDEDFEVVRTDVDRNDATTDAENTGTDTGTDAGTDTPSTGGRDDDAPLTGATLARASRSALAATGGGKVTDSSRSDDPDHVYEVEVRLANGDEVDVELDQKFVVMHQDLDRADNS